MTTQSMIPLETHEILELALSLPSEHGWEVTLRTVYGPKAAILLKSATHSSMDDDYPTTERQTPPFSYYFMVYKF